MEAQEEWPREFHLWYTKAQMLVLGEESLWRQPRPRQKLTWGPGVRGLFLPLKLLAWWRIFSWGSLACSLGLLVAPDVVHCISERKREDQEADSRHLVSCPPRCHCWCSGPIPTLSHGLISWPGSRHPAGCLTLIPSPFSFSFFHHTFHRPYIILPVNNMSLTPLLPIPLLDCKLHRGRDICQLCSLKWTWQTFLKPSSGPNDLA